jgi:hypothetical protein
MSYLHYPFEVVAALCKDTVTKDYGVHRITLNPSIDLLPPQHIHPSLTNVHQLILHLLEFW